MSSAAHRSVAACSVGLEDFAYLRSHKGDIVATDGSRVLRLRWSSFPQFKFTATGLSGSASIVAMCPSSVLPSGSVRIHFCASRPCRAVFSGLQSPLPFAHVHVLSYIAHAQAVDLGASHAGSASGSEAAPLPVISSETALAAAGGAAPLLSPAPLWIPHAPLEPPPPLPPPLHP